MDTDSTTTSFDNSEELFTKTEKQLEKQKKREAESQELLHRVISGNIENIKDRVAFILNSSIDARNSDIHLAWQYWESFEGEKFNSRSVNKQQLMGLTKMSSLSRIRAKIQNEYKLFQADEKVRRFRGVLEEEKRQEALEDKPSGMGTYSVYIDETGKTQDFLSIGSLWVLKYSYSIIGSHKALNDWRKSQGINYEFHFNELNRHRVEEFKTFFLRFLSLHPEVGFKLIVISNKGLNDKNSAITDLTYHLLTKGVQHENETGRATLPRLLQVWVDEEEKGSDRLKLENIQERISSQKIKGLYLGNFNAVSSNENFFIQVVDLFTGAVNRKLHNKDSKNFKDEFADFLLGALKFDISNIDVTNSLADNATVFDLVQ